jgi:hypothetical protein
LQFVIQNQLDIDIKDINVVLKLTNLKLLENDKEKGIIINIKKNERKVITFLVQTELPGN